MPFAAQTEGTGKLYAGSLLPHLWYLRFKRYRSSPARLDNIREWVPLTLVADAQAIVLQPALLFLDLHLCAHTG